MMLMMIITIMPCSNCCQVFVVFFFCSGLIKPRWSFFCFCGFWLKMSLKCLKVDYVLNNQNNNRSSIYKQHSNNCCWMKLFFSTMLKNILKTTTTEYILIIPADTCLAFQMILKLEAGLFGIFLHTHLNAFFTKITTKNTKKKNPLIKSNYHSHGKQFWNFQNLLLVFVESYLTGRDSDKWL